MTVQDCVTASTDCYAALPAVHTPRRVTLTKTVLHNEQYHRRPASGSRPDSVALMIRIPTGTLLAKTRTRPQTSGCRGSRNKSSAPKAVKLKPAIIINGP